MNAPVSKELEIALTPRSFESQIAFFNGMYKLPVAPYPMVTAVCLVENKTNNVEAIKNRLGNLKKILIEEVEEVDDIILSFAFGIRIHKGQEVKPTVPYSELDLLTDLADWLGDIQVFCASEMAKFGIPLKETLAIIMGSNFSKLGVNGEPLYDARGKVMKGPGYWKPEPQLKVMLQEHITEANPKQHDFSRDIVWRPE